MSLLRDMIVTLGDALRLSNDLMRHKLEAQAKALKRGIGRLMMGLAFLMTAVVLAGTGAGFLLFAVFVYIARATGPAAAGLIVGFGLLLIAIVMFLIGRSAATRLRS